MALRDTIIGLADSHSPIVATPKPRPNRALTRELYGRIAATLGQPSRQLDDMAVDDSAVGNTAADHIAANDSSEAQFAPWDMARGMLTTSELLARAPDDVFVPSTAVKARTRLEHHCMAMRITVHADELAVTFSELWQEQFMLRKVVQETLDWLDLSPTAEKEAIEARQKTFDGVVDPIMMQVHYRINRSHIHRSHRRQLLAIPLLGARCRAAAIRSDTPFISEEEAETLSVSDSHVLLAMQMQARWQDPIVQEFVTRHKDAEIVGLRYDAHRISTIVDTGGYVIFDIRAESAADLLAVREEPLPWCPTWWILVAGSLQAIGIARTLIHLRATAYDYDSVADGARDHAMGE